MLCPRCHGTHVVWEAGAQVPCPECHGAGELHCCDGLQEQPEEPVGSGRWAAGSRPKAQPDGPRPETPDGAGGTPVS